MSLINSASPKFLISLILSCGENPSDIKSKNIIADICNNLEYKSENVVIFKLIFENKIFYPLPSHNNIFTSSCINGLIELVECLLQNIDDSDIPRTINEASLVYETIAKGHLNVAKLLIEKKILNKNNTGQLYPNGLYLACENGYIEIVNLLLAAGVEPHISNLSIYNAAKGGHYEIVKILLDYPLVSAHNYNHSAICIAATRNYDDIVKLILQKRPNITPEDFKSDNDINKKIISIYNELNTLPCVEISVPSNNNECLNNLLKQLRQEMATQNIFKITITSDSIWVTNDLKI